MSFPFLIYFLLISQLSASDNNELLNKLNGAKWMCGNELCTEAISVAKSKRNYNPDHILKLHLKTGDNVDVLGKPKDLGEEFWLVKVGEKIGVASKIFLQESNIKIQEEKCLEITYDFSDIVKQKHSISNNSITPSPTPKVLAGTTVYETEDLDEDDGVNITDYSSNETSEEASNKDKDHERNLNLALVKPQHTADVNIANALDIQPLNNSAINIQQPLSDSASTIPKPLSNSDDNSDLNTQMPLNDSDDNSDLNTQKPLNDSALNTQKPLNDSALNTQKPLNDSALTIQQPVNDSTDNSHLRNIENNTDAFVVDVNVSEQNIVTPSFVEMPVLEFTVNEKEEAPSDVQLDVKYVSETTPLVDAVRTIKGDVTDGTETGIKSEGTALSFNETDLNNSNTSNKDTLIPPPTTFGIPKYSPPTDSSDSLGSDVPQIDSSHFNGNEQSVAGEFKNEIYPVTQDYTTEPHTESQELEVVNNELNSSVVDQIYTTEAPEKLSTSAELLGKKSEGQWYLFSKPESPDSSTQTDQSNISQLTETSDKLPSTENPKILLSVENIDNIQTVENTDKLLISTVLPQESIASSEPLQPDVAPIAENSALVSEEVLNLKPHDNLQFTTDQTHNQYSINATQNEDLEKRDYENSTSLGENDTSNEPKDVNDTSNEPKDVNDLTNEPNLENIVDETIKSESAFTPIADSDPNNLYEIVDSNSNWFSPFTSVMNSIKDMFVNSDIGVDDSSVIEELSTEPPIDKTIEPSHEKSDHPHIYAENQQSCEKDPLCDSSSAINHGENKQDYEHSQFSSFNFTGPQMSLSTATCLIITALVIIIFSLGNYYLQNIRRDGGLIDKISSVSHELFFTQRELAGIEELFNKTKEDYHILQSETSSSGEAIMLMNNELQLTNTEKERLNFEIKRLEKEIDSLVESGNEMHRMLAESVSDDEKVKTLFSTLEDLRSVLSDRLDEIASLTEQLDNEKQEVKLLTISLQKSENKCKDVEEKLEKAEGEFDSKSLVAAKDYEDKITSLERAIENISIERTNFEREIFQLKKDCDSISVLKELAEKELKKAHGMGPGKAMTEWLEAKEVRAELLQTQKQVEKLQKDLEEAKRKETQLDSRGKELLSDIEVLNNNYETAEKEKIEALTKLQVLSNYFKEKETQLQEELGERESQWLQKQSEDHTIYEQMRSLREENLSFKAQNEALKKEILDQEASFKIQIANEEQKAQGYWISLRHTERRLKEVQMETSHLRTRLTALEAKPDSNDEKHKSLDLVNGEINMGAASPPFMMYPPPDFIPPPPLMSPSRPPPLGRLSSPPMTPPPPLSPFEMYPPAPSPPPLHRVLKPHPREPTRKPIDSHSSNQSSESTDKPVRRGKR